MEINGIQVTIIFFLLLVVGIPVAYSLLFVSSLYILLSDIPFLTVMQRIGNATNSISLLAVPTFIFAGTLMNQGRITKSIFDAVNSTFIGKIKGGLAQVNILASLIFSGMAGAALADLAGLGNIEIAAMKDNGYPINDALGITLASSAIGPIFPPSIPLIIYSLSAQVSALRILLAGVVPGILIALSLMVEIVILTKKRNYPRGNIKESRGELSKMKFKAIPALLAPVILLGGFFTGAYSPTELASVAVLYAMILGFFIYKGLNRKTLIAAARECTETISDIFLIVAGAVLFSFVITVEQIPMMFKELLLNISDNPIVLLLIANVILLIVGMFINTVSAIMIFTPILLPPLVAVGLDPIHIGIVFVLNLVIGMYTPPFGICLFMAKIMTKQDYGEVIKSMLPYYPVLFLALILITLFPQLCLWLPNIILAP